MTPDHKIPDHESMNQKALPDHFGWIDGLRGVASLAVVVYHYHHFFLADYADRVNIPPSDTHPWHSVFGLIFEHGSSAVQLFWVISGFVFAHVYLNRATKVRSFIVARVARLYPLHFVTLMVVAGVQLASLTWVGHWQIYGNNDLRHFGMQLVMSSNWTTLSRGLSFNGPIWSVSLEFVAYGLFLIALPAIRRFGLIAAVGLTGAMWWLGLDQSPDIPGIRRIAFICAGYFFLGNCTYLIFKQVCAWHVATFALVVVALLACVWSVWSGIEHLPYASASIAIICCAAAADVQWRRPAIGWLKRLGDMSYSIYLIHVPLQMIVLLLDDTMFGGTRAFAASLWTLPAYLLLTVWLADLIYRQFEVPASRLLRRTLSGRS